MSDDEKHEWCMKRTGYRALILPPSLYRAVEAHGYDMRWYVMDKKIPVEQPSK